MPLPYCCCWRGSVVCDTRGADPVLGHTGSQWPGRSKEPPWRGLAGARNPPWLSHGAMLVFALALFRLVALDAWIFRQRQPI